MAEVIDRKKLDILHVHYAMPHAISAILARDIAKRDVKIVTTLHGTDITVLGYDKTFKSMIAYGIEQSDAVTAVSDHLVKQTQIGRASCRERVENTVAAGAQKKKTNEIGREQVNVRDATQLDLS